MPLETEYGFVRRHAASVVSHLNQRPSRILYGHGHCIGSGIHGIFHKFLHYGSRPLDYLPGGYHVRYVARQNPYIHLFSTEMIGFTRAW